MATVGDRQSRLVSAVDSVASLPMTVKDVLDLSYHPATNAEQLAEAISRDPVLSAKILQVVNSSFFAFFARVTDIQSAVVRLGMKNVRNITLSMSVAKLYTSPVDSDGYSRPNVWRHSVAVGILNELLTSICAPEEKDLTGEALLTGLVHDIGIILEDQYEQERFTELPAMASSLKEPLYTIERNSLGFDHQSLGSAVLAKWRFPPRICAAIGQHHGVNSLKGDLLAQMTAMSELLATAKRAGYCDVPAVPKDLFGALARRLGLKAEGIHRIKSAFDERYSELSQIFDIDVASPSHSTRHHVN